MELLELFDTVELDEFIMIILTIIIACSAYSQARNTKTPCGSLGFGQNERGAFRIVFHIGL